MKFGPKRSVAGAANDGGDPRVSHRVRSL